MKTIGRLFVTTSLIMALATASIAEIRQLAPNYYVAGVRSGEFQYFAARQRRQNWCWAACVQMVLNYHGLYVQQEQVVQRIFGQQVDEGGTPEQILYALRGWAPDARGRFSEIHATPFMINNSSVVSDLVHRWPLIVGLDNPDGSGHAYVLTAVYYSLDSYNRPVIDKVVLRDPWPENESRQEMSWSTFESRRSFAARIHVHRL